MRCRSCLLTLLLVASGCAFAQDEVEEAPIDTAAVRLNNEAVEAMSEILRPRSPADTAAYRDIIAQFQRAYRLDTTYTTALMNASAAYASLGEWDSTIVVLERGVNEEPGFAELIGYYRMHLGQPEEAQRAFEHTLEAVEAAREEALSTLTGFEREAYAGGLVRLHWLAEGREAALAAFAELDASLQQAPQVRYAECLARRADKEAYAATYTEQYATAPPDDPLPHEACEAHLH
jgi:tetratricopeptide (TPR) repeat protein